MTHSGIKPCAQACGFDLLHEEPLQEIAGTAYVFSHAASGARLLYLANDDNNKGFSITFKTPASDDTGVFHILEHSVLCGSRKFPVKEPFVNLLKSSMQTFLNAMTFPDKTMYPVASTNERDLLNLADVYLDAVFHPNIYENPRIFEQEGWHYELEGRCDGGKDCEDAGSLAYNGVVYNEMKGALSDPDSVLYDTLSAALFPDTTYRFESGGTPEGIPTLTYAQFLETHARHYHPSNSYIVLYGNMDPQPFLAQADECLRGAMEGLGCAQAGCTRASAPAAPNPMEMQEPVVAEGVRRTMATAPENSCAALGFVAGRADERERMVAASVLLDAIMGSNEAPMKRALLDADVADDCDGFLADSVLQPFVAITARGLHGDDAADRLRDTVADTAASLADGGLDMRLVEAALSHAEFVMREGNFGYADGVVASMAAMNGWLYDDDPAAAVAYLRYEDAFASLREKLAGDYFRRLVAELFVESGHRAQVQVVPVDCDEEAAEHARLATLEAAMTPDELAAIAAEAAALQQAQTAPDDPADLAKLPRLARTDVGEAPALPACRSERLGPMEVLRHDVDTRGIVYATRYFDLGCVAADELPYATVLAMTLGKLDTARHTAAEIDTIVQGSLGSLDFACEMFDVLDAGDDAGMRPAEEGTCGGDAHALARKRGWRATFTVGTSALSENADVAAGLANEVLTQTDFGDTGKLLDVLVQRKVAMEQRFAMAGNSVAAARAASYAFPSAALRERAGGIDFYVFLKRLIDDFDAQADLLAAKLAELAGRLFKDEGCLLSFAGAEDAFRRYAQLVPIAPDVLDGAAAATRHASGASADAAHALVAPSPVDRREAFAVPTDVTYSALVSDRLTAPGAGLLTGSWMVASKVLSYDYLWNEVRVVGGAYGVGFSTSRAGASSFFSYRDPRVAETLERFRASSAWLAAFDPSEEEFEGYVVSCAASFDKPLKPRDLVRRQAAMHLARYGVDEFLRRRQEVLDARIDDVRALAGALGEMCARGRVCVVGNRDIIEQAATGLNVVDLLAM